MGSPVASFLPAGGDSVTLHWREVGARTDNEIRHLDSSRDYAWEPLARFDVASSTGEMRKKITRLAARSTVPNAATVR